MTLEKLLTQDLVEDNIVTGITTEDNAATIHMNVYTKIEEPTYADLKSVLNDRIDRILSGLENYLKDHGFHDVELAYREGAFHDNDAIVKEPQMYIGGIYCRHETMKSAQLVPLKYELGRTKDGRGTNILYADVKIELDENMEEIAKHTAKYLQSLTIPILSKS